MLEIVILVLAVILIVTLFVKVSEGRKRLRDEARRAAMKRHPSSGR